MPETDGRGHTWGEALDGFADWLRHMEARLEADDWDMPPATPRLPVLTGTPTDEQRIRATELQLRLTACEARLRGRLTQTGAALQELHQRRDVARSYAAQGG